MRTSIACFLSFLAGVAVTLAVVSDRVDRFTMPPSATESPATEIERQSAGPVQRSEAIPLEQLLASESPRPEQSHAGARGASAAAPRPGEVPVTTALDPLDQPQRSPAPTSVSGRAEPAREIPLIDGLKLEGRVADAHEQLGLEDRNSSWAPYMEAQLLGYLGAQAALLQEFSVPTVTCRQSMCEIQVIGYGANAFETWMNQTSAMLGQPWAAEFGGNMMVNTMPVAPGVQGMVFILKRESGIRSLVESATADLRR